MKKTSKNKILFLWLDSSHFMAQEIKKYDVMVSSIYKKINSVSKVFRRSHQYLDLPRYDIWYESWFNQLDRFEVVIVPATIITLPVVRDIRKKNPALRLIVWYWNPVEKSVNPNSYSSLDCELWSFDENDCKTYNLKHNTQYYCSTFVDTSVTFEQSKDILFVGADKGRFESLLDYKLMFERMGLNTDFHITSNRKTPLSKRKYLDRQLPYHKVLEKINRSSSILDFVSENQYGLTLRPMEAIFHKKKLITNNIEIDKYDFYDKDNIFILGKDELSSLQEFINSPYINLDRSIIDKYEFDNWLSRFLNN
jgi:hypothetical protein